MGFHLKHCRKQSRWLLLFDGDQFERDVSDLKLTRTSKKRTSTILGLLDSWTKIISSLTRLTNLVQECSCKGERGAEIPQIGLRDRFVRLQKGNDSQSQVGLVTIRHTHSKLPPALRAAVQTHSALSGHFPPPAFL